MIKKINHIKFYMNWEEKLVVNGSEIILIFTGDCKRFNKIFLKSLKQYISHDIYSYYSKHKCKLLLDIPILVMDLKESSIVFREYGNADIDSINTIIPYIEFYRLGRSEFNCYGRDLSEDINDVPDDELQTNSFSIIQFVYRAIYNSRNKI